MVGSMPHRVRVYHTGETGTSPEPWQREVQAELRCRISSLDADRALSENALGRWEQMATHRARVEYSAAVVVNCVLKDVVTESAYLVLSVKQANRQDAAGTPDHLNCMVAVLVPPPDLE